MMQPQTFSPPTKPKGFPRKTFKMIGGLTIFLGALCVVIGISEIIYSFTTGQKCIDWANRHIEEMLEHTNEIHMMSHDEEGIMEDHLETVGDEAMNRETRCITMTSIGIIAAIAYSCCGMVFIVTGSLGVGAARTLVNHRQSGLKTGYIVMNILGVLGFAPTVFVLGTGTAIAALEILPMGTYNEGHSATGILVGLIGAALNLLSLVAASISCCCAPVTEEVKVITVPAMPAPQVTTPAEAGLAHVQLQVDEKAMLLTDEAFYAQPVDASC